MAYAWGSLLAAVRTGDPAYHTVFGRPFWEDLQAHPDVAASFDALMGPAGHGTPDPEVLVTGGWESVRTVVDVGGGTGSLLAEILRARPTVRGTLVDLPATVARSGCDLSGGRRGRTRHRGGAELLRPAAGRGRSLSAQERAARLARSRGDGHPARCARRRVPPVASSSSAACRPTRDGGPSPALLMMVLVGGKDRSLAEFREMARAAGLEVQAAGRQPSGRFVVECRPIC